MKIHYMNATCFKHVSVEFFLEALLCMFRCEFNLKITNVFLNCLIHLFEILGQPQCQEDTVTVNACCF